MKCFYTIQEILFLYKYKQLIKYLQYISVIKINYVQNKESIFCTYE